MTEHKRANAEFFESAASRQATYATDTILVAHPSDMPQSSTLNKGLNGPHSLSRDHGLRHKQEYSGPGTFPKNQLKEECLKLPDAAQRVLSADTLHRIALPDQEPLVDEVKRALDKAVKGLKADLENIFGTA
jgi:hypothetical protein